MSRSPSRLATPILLAGLLAMLAGCGPKKDEFAPACPRASPVWEAADLSRYQDATAARLQDIRGMVLSGRLVGIPAKCEPGDKPTQLAADVGVTFQFTRGPAMQGRAVEVPFFLAVSEGGRILDKKIFSAHIAFPPNVDQVTWSADPVHMVFPISPTKSGAAYVVLAGFQLTPEELAYNRSHPKTGP